MSWNLDVVCNGPDTLTMSQANTLKAAVATALSGLTYNSAKFSSDQLVGVSGSIVPPLASDIAMEAQQHVAIRN